MDRFALLELLLAGFFAVACIRARAPLSPNQTATFSSFFRFSGRLERLRRSRWQWFSMVAIMLVLRVQHQLPPAVEIMVGMMFLIFLVCPVRALVKAAR
ncbi:MAG: hypothetical protein DMG96_13355 [Acidobacteria bacterium]|nr:MAG: hypothetical protein DMG96_13355 [Acidobacteriota bacterium]